MKDFILTLYERPITHLGAVAVFGMTFIAARWYLSRQKLPPGPPALPLVGSLPWMRGDMQGICLIQHHFSDPT